VAVGKTADGRWFSYRRDGKRQVRTYFGRGATAELAARAHDDATRKRPAPQPAARRTSGPTLEDLAIDYCRRTKWTANSLRCLKLRLSANILPALGHLHATRLTYAHLDRYIAERSRPAVAANHKKPTVPRMSTLRREVTDILAIMSWAMRRRLIGSNPLQGYRRPDPDDAVIMPPTPEEITAILAAAPDHLRRAVIISWYTGLRPGAVELFSLTWAHWARHAGSLRVVSARKGGPPLRDVPVHPAFEEHLAAWHQEDKGRGHIVHYRGRAVRSLRTSWTSTLNTAGITRRLRMYDLRHHFVTRALEAGADIGALAGVVGSSPQTLRRYYQHVSDDLRRKAVALVPELPGPKK
jgi:site-specific recombinase XerD